MGLASLASDIEKEAARPQAEEIEAEEGPRAGAAETAQAEADDVTAGDGAHDKYESTESSTSSVLASEGPAKDRPTTQRGRAIDSDDSRTGGPAGKPADTASPKATARPRQRLGEHAKPTKPEPPRPPQKPSSSRKWIWLVLIGAVAFFIFHETQKDDGKAPENVSVKPMIASKPAVEAQSPQRKERLPDLRFSKPQVGRDNMLNVAELRWCLREDIRIGTLRPQPTTNSQIDEFNRLVSDYNRRCGSFRYREGTLARARREVEQHRSEIVASVSPPWARSGTLIDGRAAASGSERGNRTVEIRPSATRLRTEPEPVDRVHKAGRSASDPAPKQIEETEPAEALGPRDIEDGGAQTETTTVNQVSEEARDSETARRERGPEQTGQLEATQRQESDEDPPSSRRKLIRKIQMYLTALGYEPGPIDGLYGRRTKGAIEAFERDMGMTPTGEATIELWRKVRRGVKPETEPQHRGESTEATRKIEQTSRGNVGHAQGAPEPTDPARESERTTQDRNSEQHSGATDASHFTMGSHSDDVLRIQGKPDAITRYDALGTMTWRYGSSNVEFATPSSRIRQWTNRGNLRVEMRPGLNTTEGPHFTLGSHIDDVLRVQGTPSAITRYDALGTMTWRYGSSKVEIATPSKTVRQWTNRGSLRVEMRPGRNTTGGPHFTLGSHIDDVLRLQGTPSAITRYDASGTMTWRYNNSTVEVSMSTMRVMDWRDRGNLRVRK